MEDGAHREVEGLNTHSVLLGAAVARSLGPSPSLYSELQSLLPLERKVISCHAPADLGELRGSFP